MGILWLSLGVAYFWVEETEGFNTLSLINFLLGLAYLGFYFLQKDRNQEFIAWDEEQVILSKWLLKPVTYHLSEANQITITNSYFIFKSSPEVPGETMELSGYSESDLNLLKSRFYSEIVASA